MCIRPLLIVWLFLSGVVATSLALPSPESANSIQSQEECEAAIPPSLKSWESWALWGMGERTSPSPYSDGNKYLTFWPARLEIFVSKESGSFDLGVTVFSPTWVPLPGGADVWPLNVTIDGKPVPVLEHGNRPSLYLQTGMHRILGKYLWENIPQRLPIPPQVGLIGLTIDGKAVESPIWDGQGELWLRRDGNSKSGEKDFLSVTLYSLLEDGVPLTLRTRVELLVSGKNREEQIGAVIPEGWKLFSVESGIPVAVDESGGMKAQVRPGKWTIELGAYSLQDVRKIDFAKGVTPAVKEQLVAFHARPDFRLLDISGATPIDASQTTIPSDWKKFPVFRWQMTTPIRLEERLRGMGTQKAEGLDIRRELWLDSDGKACTFHDFISGKGQQIWRLDVAPGEDLGSVSMGREGQLITSNPVTGVPGIEIRTRSIGLQATGRLYLGNDLSATGWLTDAGNVSATLNLPPGWRLFALFGADWVDGDWLTAWNLLDLFLLLIFTLAVFRLWGFVPAVVAFSAFALSYHELGAPRYTWLILLMPLAFSRIIKEGWAARVVFAAKWVAIAALLFSLIPFLSQQLQKALYPQLEQVTHHHNFSLSRQRMIANAAAPQNMPQSQMQPVGVDGVLMGGKDAIAVDAGVAGDTSTDRGFGTGGSARSLAMSSLSKGKVVSSPYRNQNLQNDLNASIQTGPAQPTWKWRSASFGWNGPVTSTQTVHPVLIPLWLERILTVVRIVLLILLASILLDGRRAMRFIGKGASKITPLLVIGALTLIFSSSSLAQIPDQSMIDILKSRLLQPSTAYPKAADIPSASLKLEGRRLQLDLEVHAALRTAVPLPGNLPSWSPLTVLLDGKPADSLLREEGFLWVVIPEGIHKIQVTGLIGDVTDWEWTFRLKPRRVTIDAPEWTVSGVHPNGVPEQQIFLSLKQKTSAGSADYDNPNLKSIVVVERNMELGLVWHVHTTVSRRSPDGRALSLSVPLLTGESILTPNAIVKEAAIEVHLGAREENYSWDSELPITNALHVASSKENAWVETWRIAASPVWNIAFHGLAPVFEPNNSDLIPVWHPWPGEEVFLTITRPIPVAGATITVDRGRHETTLGRRQRDATLDLNVRCSVGQDFRITLPDQAQVTSLKLSGQQIPVRMEGNVLVASLRPGSQNILLAWTAPVLLNTVSRAGEIRLPVDSSNITTVIRVPDDRWTLFTFGPLIGPAVRYWPLLIGALIAALMLGRFTLSPIKTTAWLLLLVGLTQANQISVLCVILWFFLLAWRGSSFQVERPLLRNIFQGVLLLLTATFFGIMILLLNEGLLGAPHMFIIGNYSNSMFLQWTEPRCGVQLPQPGCITISIWWYRLLMLLWALWLASSMLRWMPWAWTQFSSGGVIFRSEKKALVPPVPPPLGKN